MILFTKQKRTAIFNTMLKDYVSGQNRNGNNYFTLDSSWILRRVSASDGCWWINWLMIFIGKKPSCRVQQNTGARLFCFILQSLCGQYLFQIEFLAIFVEQNKWYLSILSRVRTRLLEVIILQSLNYIYLVGELISTKRT